MEYCTIQNNFMENVNFTAKGNVNITAKENISTFNSKDKKSGSEIGVSFSVNGISIYGNAYGMKEKGEGLEKLVRTDTKIFGNLVKYIRFIVELSSFF